MESVFPAWLAGFFCGFVASIGVGPVNLTVIEQGLRRGFRSALLAGLGAIMAETIYAVLALTGHARLFPNSRPLLLAWRIAAAVIVFLLGLRYLLLRPQEERLRHVAEKMDERWHHPRAWALGFLVTISNPTLFLLWATLAALLYAHGFVHPVLHSRIVCAGGVLVGGMLWYGLVAGFVARAHRTISMRAIILMQRICGAIFLVFAAFLVYRILVP